MRTKYDFTIKKKVSLMLPIPLVCKKTGYIQKYIGPESGWMDGDKFCIVGETYELTSAVTLDDGGIEFTMQTDTILDDNTTIQTTHKMDYEFMVEYFFVGF